MARHGMAWHASPLSQASLPWTIHQEEGLPSFMANLTGRVSYKAGLRCADGIRRKVRVGTLQLQAEASRSQSSSIKQCFLGCLPFQSRTSGSMSLGKIPVMSQLWVPWLGRCFKITATQGEGIKHQSLLKSLSGKSISGKCKINDFETNFACLSQARSKVLPQDACMPVPTRTGILTCTSKQAPNHTDPQPPISWHRNRLLKSMGRKHTVWHHQWAWLISQPVQPYEPMPGKKPDLLEMQIDFSYNAGRKHI